MHLTLSLTLYLLTKLNTMKKLILSLAFITIATFVIGQNIALFSTISGRYAALQSGNVDNNTPIITWTDECQADLIWTKVTVPGSSNFKLRNVKSGKFMAVASAGTANGSKIVLYEDKGQADILWITEPSEHGSVRIKNVNSGKYLGIESAAKTNGAALVLWENKNQQDIKWNLLDLSVFSTTFDHISNCGGNWYIALRPDTVGSSDANPYLILGAAERWTFEQTGTYYKIKSERNLKYIGVRSGSNEVGADIVTSIDRGQADVQWEIVRVSPDGFKLKNKQSGLFLGIEGGSTAKNSKLVQWRDEGQKDIVWKKSWVLQ